MNFMMYVIVRWTGETYEIVHYSHDSMDAERMYEVYTQKYGKVWLMIDERVARMHEELLRVATLQRNLAETRKKIKDAAHTDTELED